VTVSLVLSLGKFPATSQNKRMNMKSSLTGIAVLLAAFVLTIQGQPVPTNAVSAPAKAAVRVPPQAPDVAAPKLGRDGQPDPRFIQTHEKFVAAAKAGNVDLLFLGDSITAGWSGHKDIWTNAFGAFRPANFGIGGDRTQHVLWRVTQGELEGIKPKAVVLMIGTNNSGSDPADGIASGVAKIVETIRAKLPAARVLLLAVFPRGEKPNPTREKLKQVNDSLAKLDDGKQLFYLDIGNKFLEPNGTLTREVSPDLLHLSTKGYQIWADAITPKLAELMK
jgi:lysophospholipase L1-like esterase